MTSEKEQSKLQQLNDYTVFVVTWNVGSKFPDNISLRNLLGLQSIADATTLPDIYAVGLQEVNSQPQQQVLGLFKEDPWSQKTKDALREYNYVLIKTEQMQGLLLSMFVKRIHVPHLRDIEAEFTRTGFGGIWGNKGAVSIRFTLYGCGMTFVAAHLAAHDQHLDERIEDYKQILENHHYHVTRYREIFDHDYVFWFGDLNFRLKGEDSSEEVIEAVRKEKTAELLKRDQLLDIREVSQQAFQLMHERTPEFPPTFKFKEGTSDYDPKRRPAWTDRILYAVQPLNRQPNMPLSIEQRSYKSFPGYTMSDHKPVTSEFLLKLYPNYRAPCVEFTDIPIWEIGEEYTVEYKKPNDFEERDHDWIGIYRVNYASLTEYIAYEYVNQAETPPSSDSTEVDTYFDTPSTHRRGRHHHRNRQRLRRQREANDELVRIDFSDDIELKCNETYLLIYVQNTGLRGVTSIAGMSNAFQTIKRRRRSRSPRAEHAD
ncbi:phosphatidylinositol 4,5-bisphosphate 5-phosphatase A [Teleopsis dalmanni]|uniref:phosphatidylinositol 4,5-bisphosphate 5-phosphatase A n=1 Tax=Teleopsis dalmanni TaxID=139649 RepID=UPI0018CFBC8A|nr:phosphatidylinositol 4,5-bisphosphate 5-phosphatase A [Teleopsis dalmanni]